VSGGIERLWSCGVICLRQFVAFPNELNSFKVRTTKHPSTSQWSPPKITEEFLRMLGVSNASYSKKSKSVHEKHERHEINPKNQFIKLF
jgi:hypothetical protein